MSQTKSPSERPNGGEPPPAASPAPQASVAPGEGSDWHRTFDAQLAELSAAVLVAETAQEVANATLDLAQRLTESPYGYVGYIDPQTGFLVSPTLTRDVWAECQVPGKAAVFEKFAGLWGWVLEHRQPLLTNSPASDPRSSGTPEGHVPIRSLLSVPALAGEQLVGQISVANAPRAYEADDLLRLQRLSAVFALGVRRAQMADALRASEARYRMLVENQGEGIGLVDTNERFLFANPAAEQIFGVGAGGLLGKSLRELTDPAEFARVLAQTALRRAGSETTYELEILRPDGERRTILVTATPQTELDGGFKGTFGVFRDVTERRRAEAAVRLGEQRLRALYELSQKHFATERELVDYALEEAVRLTGSQLGYVHFVEEDQRTVSLFAWSAAVLRTCRTASPGHQELARDGAWAECARTGKPCVQNDYAAAPHRREFPTGHPPLTRHLSVPVLDRDRLVVLSGVANKAAPYDDSDVLQLQLFMDGVWKLIARMRTEQDQRALEEQLRASQKMEAVGQLAGGLAHDFNNILAAINGYADVLLEEMPPRDPLREDIAEIRRAGDRAASLVRQLLAFSRRQVLQPRVLNVNDVVGAMSNLLARLIGEDIQLETSLAPELESARVDPGQVEQILMNLATNARDAMPRGGKLRVETSNALLDEEYAARHAGVVPGPHVMIAVSDTGAGMDPQTQSRMFEPFFTTKEPGKGTGLGLSTVYGIVRQSNGSIFVYSEPSRGTSIKIYLPVAPPEAPHLVQRHISDRPRIGTETILVVEDEEAVRSLAQRILSAAGYKVLTAAGGHEALELCATLKDPIDLLLTDVVMPQMSGPELARRLGVLLPDLRVLFMSGYTDRAIGDHHQLEPGVPFIAKPFPTGALARKVRETLGEAPTLAPASSPPADPAEDGRGGSR